MATKKRVTISWSGGKDSALALGRILAQDDCEVTSLHTVFNEENRRVGLHGVPEDLIEAQARALGLPLERLYLKSSADHTAYEQLMERYYRQSSLAGLDAIVFGDIFLEDLREFRDKLISRSGMGSIYPLWKSDTQALMKEFLQAGFRTVVCAANSQFFSKAQIGLTIDAGFLSELGPGVDACGENGEFHTFVYDGPIFSAPVDFRRGAIMEKEYMYNITGEDGAVKTVRTSFLFQELY